MRSLVTRKFRPFSMLTDMGSNFDNILDFFDSSDSKGASPLCEMVEKDTHFLYSFDIPGANRKDLKLEVQNSTLKISGERKSEHSNSSYTEKRYGSFERMISLPRDIEEESVEAHFENGVLTVAIAKSKKAHRRPVNITSGKKDGIWNKLLN